MPAQPRNAGPAEPAVTGSTLVSPGARTRGTRKVHVTDLVLDCLIGVHLHERDGTQRVRINVELTLTDSPWPIEDRLANVLCYEELVSRIRELAAQGHVNLVETLAERIASLCMDDQRVVSARVRVDKLDVFADAASVGVELELTR